jgi:hypothetical protein
MGNEVAAVGIPHQISVLDGAPSVHPPSSQRVAGRSSEAGPSRSLRAGHHRPHGKINERSGSVEVTSSVFFSPSVMVISSYVLSISLDFSI